MMTRHLQKLAVLMSLMFLPTGIFKLTDFYLAVEFFTKWGIPVWMMHFIGASELAGAIGLLMARTRPAAAFALFLLMIGGLVTHLTHGEYFFAVMPVIYGAGLYPLMKDSLPLVSVPRRCAPRHDSTHTSGRRESRSRRPGFPPCAPRTQPRSPASAYHSSRRCQGSPCTSRS